MVECEFFPSSEYKPPLYCFNRYMVECESLYIPVNLFPRLVLIDTWWNVNVLRVSYFDLQEFVLIDTWWNVN